MAPDEPGAASDQHSHISNDRVVCRKIQHSAHDNPRDLIFRFRGNRAL
jgi:hypothetical protein